MDIRDARNGIWGNWVIDEKRMVLRHRYGSEDPEERVEFPFEWVLCPSCRGRGKHVHPGIDSHGLTADDFYDDPDFAETYRSGGYDVPCYECDGKRVVPECEDEEFLKEMDDELDYRAECEAERRMGA